MKITKFILFHNDLKINQVLRSVILYVLVLKTTFKCSFIPCKL